MSYTRLAIVSLIALACSRGEPPATDTASSTPTPTSDTNELRSQFMALSVTSDAFAQGAAIPARYTCEGENISPPVSWSGAPAGTKSIALIMEDPDAPDPAKPQRVWVHWVVYNIPGDVAGLPENTAKSDLPAGAMKGKGDSGKPEYGGPCPPIGRHRYFFKLYALDTELTGLSSPSKSDLLKAMESHTIASGELMGTYQKSGKK